LWQVIGSKISETAKIFSETDNIKAIHWRAKLLEILWKLKNGERFFRWRKNGECSISPVYIHHHGWFKNGEHKIWLFSYFPLAL
jgi:hypothetical protein